MYYFCDSLWELTILYSEAVAQQWSVKKGVLRNFAKFTGKHLWQSLFLSKVAGLRPATLFKKDFGTGVFLWIFAKFLRTPPVTASVYFLYYSLTKTLAKAWFKKNLIQY